MFAIFFNWGTLTCLLFVLYSALITEHNRFVIFRPPGINLLRSKVKGCSLFTKTLRHVCVGNRQEIVSKTSDVFNKLPCNHSAKS